MFPVISRQRGTFSRSVRFLDERTQANRIRMTSTKTAGGKRPRRPGLLSVYLFFFSVSSFFFLSPLLSSFFRKGYFDFPPVRSTLTKPRRFLGWIHGLARRPARPKERRLSTEAGKRRKGHKSTWRGRNVRKSVDIKRGERTVEKREAFSLESRAKRKTPRARERERVCVYVCMRGTGQKEGRKSAPGENRDG